MDVLLRTIAISIEVILLMALLYCLLSGARLTIFDLGVRPKYGKAVAMTLVAVGVILVVFFIAHLITFYPTM